HDDEPKPVQTYVGLLPINWALSVPNAKTPFQLAVNNTLPSGFKYVMLGRNTQSRCSVMPPVVQFADVHALWSLLLETSIALNPSPHLVSAPLIPPRFPVQPLAVSFTILFGC